MAIDRSVELTIDGMTCQHCVTSVTEELSEIPSVQHVNVQLNPDGPSTVTVTSNQLIDDGSLIRAIDEAGYTMTSLKRDF